jgi:A/G-specific adenine glycosylase
MSTPGFTTLLMNWHLLKNLRTMPWKGVRDPYKVWLSEIILQQTRVEQGRSYYEKIISHFSTIQELAAAEDTMVFKLWEGLGYYSRCRNMLFTARYIVNECGGNFPSRYADLLKLKGVGPYTAAAIASFCFDEPVAVLDGNVFRVLSRIWGDATPIDTKEGKAHFQKLADKSIDRSRPGVYNQAIMDFGATVCTAQRPICEDCPASGICIARKKNLREVLPVKVKDKSRKFRYFNYLVVRFEDCVLVRERISSDIWRHLWEFVLIETDTQHTLDRATNKELINSVIGSAGWVLNSGLNGMPQRLTHRTIEGMFFDITVKKRIDLPGYQWIKTKNLNLYPFSRFCNQHPLLQKNT